MWRRHKIPRVLATLPVVTAVIGPLSYAMGGQVGLYTGLAWGLATGLVWSFAERAPCHGSLRSILDGVATGVVGGLGGFLGVVVRNVVAPAAGPAYWQEPLFTGLFVGITVALVGTLVASLARDVPVGIVGGVAAGLAAGVAAGMTETAVFGKEFVFTDFPTSVAAGVAGALGGGLAAGLAGAPGRGFIAGLGGATAGELTWYLARALPALPRPFALVWVGMFILPTGLLGVLAGALSGPIGVGLGAGLRAIMRRDTAPGATDEAETERHGAARRAAAVTCRVGVGIVVAVSVGVASWWYYTSVPRTTLRGHTSEVIAIGFGLDGRTLATGSHDGTLKEWDVATGRARTTITVGRTLTAFALARDGQTLATGAQDGTVTLWDPFTGRAQANLSAHDAYDVRAVAFVPDGRTLLTASQNSVKLWNVIAGEMRPIRELSGGDPVAVAPHGTTLAVGNGPVNFWDWRTGRARARLTVTPPWAVKAMTFSPDSRLLAITLANNTVMLWDVATRRTRVTLVGHLSERLSDLTSAAFRPDGTTLATGSHDGTVTLWDVPTAEPFATLRMYGYPGGGVRALAFSADGGTLATSVGDKAVRLWDLTRVKRQGSLGWPRRRASTAGGEVQLTLEEWTPKEDRGTSRDLYTFWDRDGHRKVEGETLADAFDGRWTSWYANGQKEAEGECRNNKQSGHWTWWYASGGKKEEGDFLDGEWHGRWTSWHENGRPKAEGDRRNGTREGRWTFWYDNGQEEAEGEFHEDRQEGRWSYWRPGGGLDRQGEWRAGARHGHWTFWHANGRKKAEGQYQDGKQEGVWSQWEQDGTMAELLYRDGKPATAAGEGHRESGHARE